MRNILLSFLIFGLAFVAVPAHATYQNNYIEKYIKNIKPVGQGRLIYLFWDVYDATLYAPNGKLSENKPFALTLKYLRDIEGSDIADVSAQEIRKQGGVKEIDIATWHKEMTNIFPSVTKGSVLTGIYLPQKGTKFFYNGKEIGFIQDDSFSKSFFNIWLGPKTSKPNLRKSLTGVQ